MVPTSQPNAAAISLLAYNLTPIGGRFVDKNNGSVVRARCTADGCSYELVSTVDGGATWRTEPVPGPRVVSAPLDDANAVVLPGGQVVAEIQVSPGRPARHTSDRGAKWPAQIAAPNGVTTQVPDTATLVAFCAQSVACPEPVMRVILPDGSSSTFGPPPSALTETISATRVADGSLWVQGRDGVGRVLLAVSGDNGAHWAVHQVPAPSADSIDLAGTGPVAWALARTARDSGSLGGSGGTAPIAPGHKMTQALYYSADSAATFTGVKVPADYKTNDGSGIGVTESGNAVISAQGKVAVLAPDGTFTAVPSVHGEVYDLGKQVLVYGNNGSWVTRDGVKWTALPSG